MALATLNKYILGVIYYVYEFVLCRNVRAEEATTTDLALPASEFAALVN